MSELIQYLQTLPIKPLLWIIGVLAVISFLLALAFVSVLFYRMLFQKKKRSFWEM